MKLKRVGAAAIGGVLAVVLVTAAQQSNAGTIAFDNFVTPTDNELANDFNQTGAAPTPYVQSSTGGITGGSVTGYSGTEYRATAVYTPSSFNFSSAGATVSESLDVFFNGQLTPLAPGANAVRSFRVGILDAHTSAFETVGNASAYIEGLYSLTDSKIILVVRNNTGSVLNSIGVSEVTLNTDHWFRLNATFTNQGNNQILYTGSFFDLGVDGNSSAALLTTLSFSFENDPMTSVDNAYAGFSALADGGIARADNFVIPQTPLPAALPLFATGLGVLGLLSWRRRRTDQTR